MEKKHFKNQKYLSDTSVIAQRKLFRLLKDKLRGTILIPNAVIAELENLANKGQDVGFYGLEEIAKLHKLKPKIRIQFIGQRPSAHQIKFAKSGEIDALIRHLAYQNHAILITADKVQWKSAEAYGIKVIFIRTKVPEIKKKKFNLFRLRRNKKH
jgi:ATPase